MNYSKSFSKSIFSLLFLIILFIATIRTLSNSNPLTFTSFLNSLQTVPSIDFSFIFSNGSLSSYYDLFIIGPIFRFFDNFYNTILFIGGGIGQFILYLIWFIGFIFG